MQSLLDSDRFSLIHGESLMTMRHLPGKAFDMICTDPPYSKHVHTNLGKERRNDGVTSRAELKFPPLNESMIASLAGEFVRLSKGWIVIFSDFYLSSTWGNAIVAAGGAWVRTGTWVKTAPMPQMTGDRPACGTEDIVICHASAHSRDWEWNARGRAAVWRGGHDRNRTHPNQKPEWLVQSILGMFAPENALVLDAFLGSGTTAAAALRTDRAIGEYYVETLCKGCSRLRAEEYAPPLPAGVRVVGIEGDIDVAMGSLERIRRVA